MLQNPKHKKLSTFPFRLAQFLIQRASIVLRTPRRCLVQALKSEPPVLCPSRALSHSGGDAYCAHISHNMAQQRRSHAAMECVCRAHCCCLLCAVLWLKYSGECVEFMKNFFYRIFTFHWCVPCQAQLFLEYVKKPLHRPSRASSRYALHIMYCLTAAFCSVFSYYSVFFTNFHRVISGCQQQGLACVFGQCCMFKYICSCLKVGAWNA